MDCRYGVDAWMAPFSGAMRAPQGESGSTVCPAASRNSTNSGKLSAARSVGRILHGQLPAGQHLRMLLWRLRRHCRLQSPNSVRRLRDAGAEVRVVLTENAARSRLAAHVSGAFRADGAQRAVWDEAAEAAMGHIELRAGRSGSYSRRPAPI